MNVEALSRYFIEQSRQRQRFGSNDCVTFVAGALLTGWGKDYTRALGYSDRRSAVRRLRVAGGLRAACDQVFGAMCEVEELRPGDVAYFERPATLGLVMPGYVAVLIASQVQRVKIEIARGGWRA